MSPTTDVMEARERQRLRLGSEEFRGVIGRFASGVTVITTAHDGGDFGTTASAVSSVSLQPPMLLVCMNQASNTGQAITAAHRFAVNVLGEEQSDLAVRFAGQSPDKFHGVAIERTAEGLPVLFGSLATLECRVVQQIKAATHVIFLAEVDCGYGRPGTPLAYYCGQFARLKEADPTSGSPRVSEL
jgi:4-nitrophenol 2-monooxygenase / 4-nitrocatechol 4-monooxygenase, reductase component